MREKTFYFDNGSVQYTEAMTLRAINRVLEKFNNECKVSSSAVLFRHLTRIAYPFKKSMFYQHIRYLSQMGLIAVQVTPHVKRKQSTVFHFTITEYGSWLLRTMVEKKFIPAYKNKANTDGATDQTSMHL